MNLEKIQEMWEKDSHMDIDNLHDESLKIPQLHQKYYTLYTTIKLLRTKSSDTLSRLGLKGITTIVEKLPQKNMYKSRSHIKLGTKNL